MRAVGLRANRERRGRGAALSFCTGCVPLFRYTDDAGAVGARVAWGWARGVARDRVASVECSFAACGVRASPREEDGARGETVVVSK